MNHVCKKEILKHVMALGGVFLLAVFLVKPIGVSTQFVIADGMIADAFNPSFVTESVENKHGYASENAYVNKSGGKYAKAISHPLNYSFVFVIAMMAGAFLSSKLRGGQSAEENRNPKVWREQCFGKCRYGRYLSAFIAGILVLYGARLAGGCTSGHMMSGMMQTALSGYIFAAGAFLTSIPTAILLFRKKGDS